MPENIPIKNIIETTSPEGNYIVHAAAGTGKTWLLTSRIMRLLLSGAEPGSLLAITFTRKAAAEIHERVMQRLLSMAGANDIDLDKLLDQIGCPPAKNIRQRARNLYETLLTTDYPLRITTFHGFCQELLHRFALECGLPPGFQVVESISALKAMAWRKFSNALASSPDSSPAKSMTVLFEEFANPNTAKEALMTFIHHRADWWAYIENQSDPVSFACNQLKELLAVSGSEPGEKNIESEDINEALLRYSQLIGKHDTKTNLRHVDAIHAAMSQELSSKKWFSLVNKVFLDSHGRDRQAPSSKILLDKLGATDLEALGRLHAQILSVLNDLDKRRKREQTRRINRAWYDCGHALLMHFQSVKRQQEVLDFSDLEWQAYRLLTDDTHAQWVQYKLDQRIDHLLVDEFQDTNPTQWRLILPLLNEIAAGQTERNRSVFIVGDVKQSIYGFRRAAPDLFHHARLWLETHTAAISASQQLSRRSSPAVIEFVNTLFTGLEEDTGHSHADVSEKTYPLSGFDTHETLHDELWGQVTLLPLVSRKTTMKPEADTGLRDPLQMSRQTEENVTQNQHRREAETLARHINELIGQAIVDGDRHRPIHFGDIIVLFRSRTHVHTYEEVFRKAEIPFSGTGKNQFLDTFEIQDVMNLLRFLVSPDNDLALASVLRSPLFSCSSADLMTLAKINGHMWWQRLQDSHDKFSDTHPLHRACLLLQQWLTRVNRIPTHDLLDHIYSSANVIERYHASVPVHLCQRVEANLNRLLALALDLDGGRYPSLSRFLKELDFLGGDDETPSTGAPTVDRRVRFMTIHAAKGLEAPVIFLADAARSSEGNTSGIRAVVDWPTHAERPRNIILAGKKAERDPVSEKLIEKQNLAERREEANLLYVALTRARQYLFISGCEPARGHRGWYGFIDKRFRAKNLDTVKSKPGLNLALDAIGTGFTLSFGKAPKPDQPSKVIPDREFVIEPVLSKPFDKLLSPTVIHPSQIEDDAGGTRAMHIDAEHAQLQGHWTHRMLELLPDHPDPESLRMQLRSESTTILDDAIFNQCWEQARNLVSHPRMRSFFDPNTYIWSRNEMPILYTLDNQTVYGIIDRVVFRENEIVIMDYKTHGSATAANIKELAKPYTTQMKLYGDGINKLWPKKPVSLALVFTRCASIVDIPYPVNT